MMLSEDEIVHIITEEDFHGTDSGHTFGLSKFKRSKWPGGIVPYTLHSSASKIIFLWNFYLPWAKSLQVHVQLFLKLIVYSLSMIWPFSAENKVRNAIGLKGMTEMAIDRAIKEWETKTCIKFVPRTNETDYVEFFSW